MMGHESAHGRGFPDNRMDTRTSEKSRKSQKRSYVNILSFYHIVGPFPTQPVKPEPCEHSPKRQPPWFLQPVTKPGSGVKGPTVRATSKLSRRSQEAALNLAVKLETITYFISHRLHNPRGEKNIRIKSNSSLAQSHRKRGRFFFFLNRIT